VGIDKDRNMERSWQVTFYSRESLRPLVYEDLWIAVAQCLREVPSYLLGVAQKAELAVAGFMLDEQVVEVMRKTLMKRLVSESIKKSLSLIACNATLLGLGFSHYRSILWAVVVVFYQLAV
jgi:hypothetical protein